MNLSAIRALEAAVEAAETGKRGREERNGGEILGGGAMMFARKCEPLRLDGSDGVVLLGVLPLLPGEVMRPGVVGGCSDCLDSGVLALGTLGSRLL